MAVDAPSNLKGDATERHFGLQKGAGLGDDRLDEAFDAKGGSGGIGDDDPPVDDLAVAT